MGTLVLVCVLIAEKGRLFGVGAEYEATPALRRLSQLSRCGARRRSSSPGRAGWSCR